MRHHSNMRKLSRTRRGRAALLRGLAIALFTHGKIVTTEAKARELRPFAEKLITAGKSGTVATRRLISSALGEPKPEIVQKLVDEISVAHKDRPGGYTRIIKMGRSQAGRDEAVIELV
ncbi:50S ribosomal protein L17 [Candidatus Kaiserbacteria bacterium RIFCSPHIGHO2_02_FULL_49_34]|uniref:50S ribosomal protein L17 n=1 Tax=Candidatus Kaiserbacteria bacterium RIFCSPHIGHO2_02_FULL_49_34 TaxID=1798491 RepID=A0A1F6DJ60_9BACT|nr:MAG: 50S ribosomal protein L17 [Candidatus Kaiserbacteria bacterium RIFCSPHIGHO2_02_FULL_49_34]